MVVEPTPAAAWHTEPPSGPLPGVMADDEPALPKRKWLILAGALGMIVSLVAFAVPALASVGTSIFIGWILICASFPIAFEAFSQHGLGRKLVRFVIAIAAAAAGLYLLVSPLEGAFTLTVILVLWFIATGIARIAVGLGELGHPGAWLIVLNGVVTLVLGVLIGRELPSSADWAIGLLVGIDLFIFSATTLWAAWALAPAGTDTHDRR
jgi:uncharacterized membrane protein HdeD (DUF308 family)